MANTLSTEELNLEHPDLFQWHQEHLGFAADWFQQKQATAWKDWLETPMPQRSDERWRFASLNQVREIGRFRPTAFEVPEQPELVERSRCLEKVAGRIVMLDDNLLVQEDVSAELASKGVVFTTLADAITRYPELVQRHFMRHSPELGSEKFEALHVAMLRNGVFLYVPDGVVIDEPLAVHYWAGKEGGAVFPHTLFVAGKGAKASLVEFQESVNEDCEHLVIANAHLSADDDAQPCHTIIQNWSPKAVSFQLNTSSAQNRTNAKSILLNVGSLLARQEIHGRIFGSETNVELYSLNVPRGEQEVDQRTLQTHLAPNSRSDLLYKNALMDRSRTVFSGLIIVGEGAEKTDAYQTNNNLMLSEEAESNSLPGLEIGANDVKCSHGATTGRIDESELFYFQARGIPREKAQELMVFGYFEEIIRKLDDEEVAEFVRQLVQNKFAD